MTAFPLDTMDRLAEAEGRLDAAATLLGHSMLGELAQEEAQPPALRLIESARCQLAAIRQECALLSAAA